MVRLCNACAIALPQGYKLPGFGGSDMRCAEEHGAVVQSKAGCPVIAAFFLCLRWRTAVPAGIVNGFPGKEQVGVKLWHMRSVFLLDLHPAHGFCVQLL